MAFSETMPATSEHQVSLANELLGRSEVLGCRGLTRNSGGGARTDATP